MEESLARREWGRGEACERYGVKAAGEDWLAALLAIHYI
jgi:hypothetical protein